MHFGTILVLHGLKIITLANEGLGAPSQKVNFLGGVA